MLAGDADRDRAATTLRKHYVSGRLTVDELSERTDLVLHARSRGELRRALAGLEMVPEARELVERGRSMVRAVVRGLALLVLTSAYVFFSFALVVVLGLTLLFDGASGTTLLGFLVVWLVPTYLLWRLWHRDSPRRRPGL